MTFNERLRKINGDIRVRPCFGHDNPWFDLELHYSSGGDQFKTSSMKIASLDRVEDRVLVLVEEIEAMWGTFQPTTM